MRTLTWSNVPTRLCVIVAALRRGITWLWRPISSVRNPWVILVLSLAVNAYQMHEIDRTKAVLLASVGILNAAIVQGERIQRSIADPETKSKVSVLMAYIASVYNTITPSLGWTKEKTVLGRELYYYIPPTPSTTGPATQDNNTDKQLPRGLRNARP